MSDFTLKGQDIEIHCRSHDDVLFVQGEGIPLGQQHSRFTGEAISRSESIDGRVFSVVLLESSRAGVQVRLNVLFPVVSRSAADQEITGAAIIVSDHRG
jgi:hypothetical protein